MAKVSFLHLTESIQYLVFPIGFIAGFIAATLMLSVSTLQAYDITVEYAVQAW